MELRSSLPLLLLLVLASTCSSGPHLSNLAHVNIATAIALLVPTSSMELGNEMTSFGNDMMTFRSEEPQLMMTSGTTPLHSASGSSGDSSSSSTSSSPRGLTSAVAGDGLANVLTEQAGESGPEVEAKFKYHVCAVDTTGTVEVSLDYYKRIGTSWKGWGTTLGWFAAYVGNLPTDERDHLLDLLFDKTKGIGLNIVRYVIPGGSHEDHSPQAKERGNVRFPPGFQPKFRGPFNFSEDSAQRNVLLEARKRGVNFFDAISHSPPWWMTHSGDVAGNRDGYPNLKLEHVGDFASYLVTVLLHYKNRYGLEFGSLSPFNEPLEDWWLKGGKQEGCGFDKRRIAAVIDALSWRLSFRNLKTTLMAFDSWSVTTAKALLDSRPLAPFTWAKQKVARVSVHGYRLKQAAPGEEEDAKEFLALSEAARAQGKPIWQTEWGPLGFEGSDLDVSLVMGRVVCQHVNLLKAEAWLHFQAIHWPNPAWGLLRFSYSYSQQQLKVAVSRQFWITKHFTRWVEPGALPLEHSCSHTITAVYHPRKRYISITIVNQRAVTRNLRFKLVNFKASTLDRTTSLQVFRTSSTENYAKISSSAKPFSSLHSFQVAKSSVTTFVIGSITKI